MLQIKRLIGVAVVCVGVLLGTYGLGIIVRPEETDGAHDQIETFHSLPKDSIEVVVYGSSHGWTAINPMDMYQEYGIGSYNYSWNWQKINTTKLFLQDSYVSQTPKIALIEAYQVNVVLEDTDMVPEVFYCNYTKDKKAKMAFKKQCLGKTPTLERRLSYFMPFAMFHDNWSDLKPENFEFPKPVASRDYLKNMGYLVRDTVEEINISGYQASVQEDLPPNAIKELDEIVRICKSHNTKVVFFITPYDDPFLFNDAMERYAAENDCVFLDLCKSIEEIGLDGKKDYKDPGHLNKYGASKVTNYVGQYLVSNYKLTDMRVDKNNIWAQALNIDAVE